MSTTAQHHEEALTRGMCDHLAPGETVSLLVRQADGRFRCSYCGVVHVEQDYLYEAIGRLEKAYEVYDRLDAALKALGPIERLAERLNVMDQALGRIEAKMGGVVNVATRMDEAMAAVNEMVGPAMEALFESPVAAMLGLERPKVIEGP